MRSPSPLVFVMRMISATLRAGSPAVPLNPFSARRLLREIPPPPPVPSARRRRASGDRQIVQSARTADVVLVKMLLGPRVSDYNEGAENRNKTACDSVRVDARARGGKKIHRRTE